MTLKYNISEVSQSLGAHSPPLTKHLSCLPVQVSSIDPRRFESGFVKNRRTGWGDGSAVNMRTWQPMLGVVVHTCHPD